MGLLKPKTNLKTWTPESVKKHSAALAKCSRARQFFKKKNKDHQTTPVRVDALLTVVHELALFGMS